MGIFERLRILLWRRQRSFAAVYVALFGRLVIGAGAYSLLPSKYDAALSIALRARADLSEDGRRIVDKAREIVRAEGRG